ncbi:MAG: ParB N-terminal domain-containing protein [Rhodobacteraceae bacterium]|nr:ParB N-terminal domain-containing protein [Paracoccaceae bacterium]
MKTYKKNSYRIELFPLDQIQPTEEHSPAHSENLRTEIEITGLWTHPLLVDQDRFALMDGHHRYHAARALGLKTIPVILLSYDDPEITLKSWQPNREFTPQDIWGICESGKLLPMKSTRHIIRVQLPFSRVPLDQLGGLEHVGTIVSPAMPHPSRVQILSDDYHAFGARMAMRTISGANLDLETASTLVPHSHLRRTLEADPAMAALLPAAPCRIALGKQEDFPFRLLSSDLLLLPPSLLVSSAAMSVAARWGMEAAFALKAGPVSPRRLAALARHGASLVGYLPLSDRALLVDSQSGGIPTELSGSSLDSPSLELLHWMAGRIGHGPDSVQYTDECLTPLSLEGPIEEVLLSNGDSRLRVDPRNGKNKYGTTPRPRPEAVHFSSSTASSISDYGFLFCDVLRRDLLNHTLDNELDTQDVRAALCDALIGELCDLCTLDTEDADGVIAPSGTDTELLAVLLARAASPDGPLVNLLVSPEETGRGVKLAGAGRYFDAQSATGAPISMGEHVWPGVEIGLVNIAIRDASGERLPIETIDAHFLKAGKAALDRGARVLAHVLFGSKTGLSGPSDAAVEELCAYAPGRVDVVVDACQMRVEYSRLGDCVRRGWMVQLSGSKSLTGPPFSGLLLMPKSYRNRVEAVCGLMAPGIGYPEDWSRWWFERLGRSEDPAFGAPFRWLPALLEARLLRHVPEALRIHVLERFRSEVNARLARSPHFKVLPRGDSTEDAPHSQKFAHHSIISFQVRGRQWDGTLQALDEASCRRVFELLNQDASQLVFTTSRAEHAVLSQEFHIGQPVVLGTGENTRVLLRLVIGMRFFNIIAHAGPGGIAAALESEISDLIRAIDKLKILAENWWSYQNDAV